MAKNMKPAAEAVNSEQLQAQESEQGPAPLSMAGELEERTVEAENRAESAERENAQLKEMLAQIQVRMGALEAAARARPAKVDDNDELLPGETPVFDESAPHGTVVGDPVIAYVQNGFQFDRARAFVCREKHRGVPRAFNPKLVGWVKPRPGAAAFDPFDGIRDKSW